MTLEWMQEAVCANEAAEYENPDHPVRIMRSLRFYFFEGYENDSIIEEVDSEGHEVKISTRAVADDMCARCPVQWECLNFAIAEESTGMHAGIYLNKGKIDYGKNHKRTDAEWDELRERILATRPQ